MEMDEGNGGMNPADGEGGGGAESRHVTPRSKDILQQEKKR